MIFEIENVAEPKPLTPENVPTLFGSPEHSSHFPLAIAFEIQGGDTKTTTFQCPICHKSYVHHVYYPVHQLLFSFLTFVFQQLDSKPTHRLRSIVHSNWNTNVKFVRRNFVHLQNWVHIGSKDAKG